jgi:hypothetical protein
MSPLNKEALSNILSILVTLLTSQPLRFPLKEVAFKNILYMLLTPLRLGISFGGYELKLLQLPNADCIEAQTPFPHCSIRISLAASLNLSPKKIAGNMPVILMSY